MRDNSLQYFHMKFRRDLLSSIVREILCAVDTKETMEITKKWTMHFQQGLLFGLRPEVAVDYYPAISTMIGREKKNYMNAVECGAPANRQSRFVDPY